jgi:imidazolonepropionase-like amidohydrolase
LPFILILIVAWSGALPCHAAADLAIVGARIYLSPSEPAIAKGSILIRGGHIVSVGPAAEITIPKDVPVINAKGLFVTAGFWNCHVHILTPGLLHANKHTPKEISSQLEAMLTRWGFTTVFDLASVLENTNLIRAGIQRGQIKGPRILTTGEPFWVKGGTPVYIKAYLRANNVHIPEVQSIAQAKERVRSQIADGADAIKIFANSIVEHGILTMPQEMATAIVSEAHRARRPVFAHVSNNQGIEVALGSGVDILAHTTPIDSSWSPSFAARLVAAHMALTPTLTLWEVESRKSHASPAATDKVMRKAARQLRAFRKAGGEVLFGTDVGYIMHFDTADEFKWMARGGMNFREILASLTTNPADRFGYSSHSGRIAAGFDGDIAILSADPAREARAFARVRYTVRAGEVIYASNGVPRP